MLVQNQKTEQTTFGLTQSQMSILTGQKLNPQIPLYNMVYTFDFAGEINVEHFRIAFQELINRSDAMRTVFLETGDKPQQTILPKLEYDLEFIDWFHENSTDRNLEKLLDERSIQTFDLSKCTFDSALIKISDQRFVWFFNEHHLTTDARSSSIIFKKMSELYAESIGGKISEVSQFPKYQNYIRHEKESRNSEKKEAVKTYWIEKTNSLTNPPKLFGRSNFDTTTDSKRVVLDLGLERSKALRALTNKTDFRSFTSDLSLFNIFSTLLLAYLYRISGQNKLVFGTPVHNRTTQYFKETPGLFIEFFPFTCEINNDDTFLTLFRRTSREAFEFLRNAQTGASTPEANRSFNVVLNYINTEFFDFNGIPSKATWHHPNHSDASHYMRLHIYNDSEAENIELLFDFNKGVFENSEIEAVPRHFLKLIDSFIENRNQGISEKALLCETESRELVVDFNKQVKAENKSVLELFGEQVKRNPEKIAVSAKSQKVTFADLDEKSNKLANFLIEKKISHGKQIALHLNRSPDLLIGILGTLKAGCAYVPIAASNPSARVKEKIEVSKSAIVLTTQKLSQKLENICPPILKMDKGKEEIERQNSSNPNINIDAGNLAYLMFTSGSSGKPKVVKISHRALANYVNFAGRKYGEKTSSKFPFFTTIDFDLTVTSIFVPLTTCGEIVVYDESETGPDLAILDVVEDNYVDVIKLTPSHLSLIKDKDLRNSKIKTMIVGGEDFKTDLAKSVFESFPDSIEIYNEYGPTEVTVGSILHCFDAQRDTEKSVPIGQPFANTNVFVLDEKLNPVPKGVVGKLFLSGESLADGYWENSELTEQKFIENPFVPNSKMYETGDLARLNRKGDLEFFGRKDEQVKIGGIRIELGEIESVLAKDETIENCVVELVESKRQVLNEEIRNCMRCGLPSNYPSAEFDREGVCNFCLSFETYQQNAEKYFKTPDGLRSIFEESKAKNKSEYDCLMLLSGGKDSSYALSRLVKMGLNVLAFTLDNGYISKQAKANIKRVCEELNVTHIFGKTNMMDEIFVNSLQNFNNVCNGCFKTIYTLSIKVALEKQIPFIVTGLSRGQFFETRLTEELFWNDDVEKIDKTILDARKTYHRADDFINRALEASVLQDDLVFEKVKFIDFYRYFDVEFEDMMKHLDEKLPWIRPTDTGRSTNCLINQVGIYVHKKKKGYSNYAFPYSWDVRMGHKTREVSLDEINEEIDEQEVRTIMREIGFAELDETSGKQLAAFYTAADEVSTVELRNRLAKNLPEYMIPGAFKRLEALPLTVNGKIDRKALRGLDDISRATKKDFVVPEGEFEEILSEIWSEVLQIENIGVHDNFLHIGGNSLAAIRIMTRANKTFRLDLPLNQIFELPTIKMLSKFVENTIIKRLSAS